MDLLEYIRDYREELVLKPNRGYGGTGVHLGAALSQSEWEALLERSAGRAARSAPAVGRAGGRDVARASLPRARRAGPHARGAVLRRHGFCADRSRPRNHRARLAEASRQRRAARRSRGRARRLSARGSEELDALAGAAGSRVARAACGRAPSCAISTASFICSSGTRRRIGRAARPRIAPRSSPCSVRCGTSCLAGDRLGDLLAALAARAGSHGARAHGARALRTAAAGGRRAARRVSSPRSPKRARIASRLGRRRGATRDYAVFLKPFAQLLRLMRERAEALRLSDDLYDGLLDEHEPGMRRARLDPLLRATGARLRALVPGARGAHARATRASAAARRLPPSGASGSSAPRCSRDMGFDFARGRLDRSTHPFTMMAGENDVRVTIRSTPRRSAAGDLRDAARGRPRALRPRAAARAARHAARRRAEHGRARVAGAALGESRRPQRRVLARTTSRRCRRAFPDALGGLDARSFPPRDQRRRAGRQSRGRRRGHLQPARARALRARDRAARRRSRGRRSAGRVGRALPALPRRQRRRGRATAACRTCTGRSASSATSRPTRSATCTRRSSSTRTTRARSRRGARERQLGRAARLARRARSTCTVPSCRPRR